MGIGHRAVNISNVVVSLTSITANDNTVPGMTSAMACKQDKYPSGFSACMCLCPSLAAVVVHMYECTENGGGVYFAIGITSSSITNLTCSIASVTTNGNTASGGFLQLAPMPSLALLWATWCAFKTPATVHTARVGAHPHGDEATACHALAALC
jgi:hypothetical protein